MAGNTINFYRTTSAKLDLLEVKNGRLIFVEDTRKLYLDNATERIEYSQIITLINDEQRLGLYRPISAFYFVKSSNSFWRYEDGKWIQLTSTPDKDVHFLDELPDVGIEEKLYVFDEKIYQWKNSKYIELNKQTWDTF